MYELAVFFVCFGLFVFAFIVIIDRVDIASWECLLSIPDEVTESCASNDSGPRSSFAMREPWREGATAGGVRCVSSWRMEATARVYV